MLCTPTSIYVKGMRAASIANEISSKCSPMNTIANKAVIFANMGIKMDAISENLASFRYIPEIKIARGRPIVTILKSMLTAPARKQNAPLTGLVQSVLLKELQVDASLTVKVMTAMYIATPIRPAAARWTTRIACFLFIVLMILQINDIPTGGEYGR